MMSLMRAVLRRVLTRGRGFDALIRRSLAGEATGGRLATAPPLGPGCPPLDDSNPCKANRMKGLVLGIYTNPDDLFDPGKLTPTGERYNAMVCGRLYELLKYAGKPPEKGEVRVYFNLDEEFSSVVVVGLGRECQGYDVFEQMDEGVLNFNYF